VSGLICAQQRHLSPMSAKLTKEEAERRIFEALAPLVGLEIVLGSTRQRPPPAPDIECDAQGCGLRAFELVALDAPHTRTRLANMQVTQEAWGRALGARAAPEKAWLSKHCTNLYLSVMTDELAGARSARRS
jgi:hypothetical protein